MFDYLVILVFCLLYTIVFLICRKALDRRKGRPSRVELRNAEGLLIESAYLLGEFRKVNLPPLVERRVTKLWRLIHAWLLDREIAKDPKHERARLSLIGRGRLAATLKNKKHEMVWAYSLGVEVVKKL